ncbi:metallophosphoesterase family protein [Falsiruegeria mediterranea]|uniref:Putative metallophosphoesterase YhaO n=1 Tax=Falsiruegeria mediterranea M17 TaxID=1200281 RepID=A0A2R8CAG3_9RHOB|nr:DNA repair exonuclease [Falsiruegeria mediterranea]SPJ29412.1 putative metallophosphoesterase YhaO [Falsiruegeria mediterranea M17]
MTGIRFLHTSDLHLGKAYGRFDEDVTADLRQAHAEIIPALIKAADEHGVEHILLAGDTFDQETPSPRLIRQTITAMAEADQLSWWIIPGNHDSLTADLIWQTFAEHAPENVKVLRDNTPVAITEGAYLLPAPCPRRKSGYDLTEAMMHQETPDGALRIGLAHGGVVDFRPDEPSAETIPPDRAERANLDYLALGDWHGALEITPRTHYSGAPERDRFKHTGRGTCLLVSLDAAGNVPVVTDIPMGKYDWQELELPLSPGLDAVSNLMELLPDDSSNWRNTLVKLHLQGYVHLDQRMALMEQIQRIAPEFCHFEWSDHQLHTEYQPDDLDQIARGGALRIAAEALKEEADDGDLARSDRDIADAALTRLYSLVKEAAE